jgi:hypothetical protein
MIDRRPQSAPHCQTVKLQIGQIIKVVKGRLLISQRRGNAKCALPAARCVLWQNELLEG